ncbi:hypothetical protein [Streptomyces sp. NPDC058572]|uniref:hypothetical protein n=1 Tax=Streptomyces sp. NPDC058572 TaxID=3346546 RepID=UPI00365B47C9
MTESNAVGGEVTDDVGEPEPLSFWSRAAAGGIGFTLCGAGVVAVFSTENQAGSATLILAGALFILLAIGGNPLHSLGFGDAQMRVAVQRRRRRALAGVAEVPPQEARTALDALQTVDPGIRNEISFRYASAHAYEGLIRQRFLSLFPDSAISTSQPDYDGFDFSVHRPEDRDIAVDVKYRPDGITRMLAREHVEQLLSQARGRVVPVLLVSNSGLTPSAHGRLREAQSAGVKVGFAVWRDEHDDEALLTTAQSLFE